MTLRRTAESDFLMRPRFRVGVVLISSGSGRVRAEPIGPIPSLLKRYQSNNTKVKTAI